MISTFLIGPELDLTKTAFLNLFFKIILFFNGFFGKGTVKILSTEREKYFFKVKRKLVGQRGEDLIYEGMIYFIIMVSNK